MRDDPVRREELDGADWAEAAALAGIVPALGVTAAALAGIVPALGFTADAGAGLDATAAAEADAPFAGAIPHTSQ